MEDSTSKLSLQLDLAKSRIRIHKKTLAALGSPEYILLIVHPEESNGRWLLPVRNIKGSVKAPMKEFSQKEEVIDDDAL